jgi:hypothetical protein
MAKSLEECDWFELDYYRLSNKVRRSDWLTEEEFSTDLSGGFWSLVVTRIIIPGLARAEWNMQFMR